MSFLLLGLHVLAKLSPLRWLLAYLGLFLVGSLSLIVCPFSKMLVRFDHLLLSSFPAHLSHRSSRIQRSCYHLAKHFFQIHASDSLWTNLCSMIHHCTRNYHGLPTSLLWILQRNLLCFLTIWTFQCHSLHRFSILLSSNSHQATYRRLNHLVCHYDSNRSIRFYLDKCTRRVHSSYYSASSQCTDYRLKPKYSDRNQIYENY